MRVDPMLLGVSIGLMGGIGAILGAFVVVWILRKFLGPE